MEPCVMLAFAAAVALTQIHCTGAARVSKQPQRQASASPDHPAFVSSASRPRGAHLPATASAREAPRRGQDPAAAADVPAGYVVVTGRGRLGLGPGTLIIQLLPPAGGTLTEGAPLRLEGRADHISFPPPLETRLQTKKLPLKIEIDVHPGATGPALIDLSYYWCSEGDSSACRAEHAKLAVKLDVTGASPGGRVHVEHRAAGIE
jgi:hypothetical protein